MALDPKSFPVFKPVGNFAPKAKNFINELFFSDCVEPWYIYVVTAVPAFIKLFITVSIFDLKDVIRWRATTGLTEGGPASRRRRGRHLQKVKIEETKTKQRAWRHGTGTLIRVTGLVEKLGFAWMLYSAGDQFFYDWQALLHQFGECHPEFDPGMAARSDTTFQQPITPEGAALSLSVEEFNTQAWGSNLFGFDVPNGIYRVTFAIDCQGGGLLLPGVTARLRVPSPLGTKVVDSPAIDIAPGANAQFIASATVVATGAAGPNLIRWQIAGPISAVGVFVNEATCVVQRQL